MHVLFVCTGNTCRSPLAEYMFNDLAKRKGVPWRAASAGVAALDGAPAAHNTVKVLRDREIEADGHQARNVTDDMIAEAFLVLTMTEAQKYVLQERYPEHAAKIRMLGELCKPVRQVDDPFGGSLSEYEACARQLQHMLEEAWPQIEAEINRSEGAGEKAPGETPNDETFAANETSKSATADESDPDR